MTDRVERLRSRHHIPPSHEIADSLLALAQDIEIGKGRVSVATPPFLREAADRVQRQNHEIERLREALRKLIEACEDETAKIPYGDGDDELQRAKRVLGDD